MAETESESDRYRFLAKVLRQIAMVSHLPAARKRLSALAAHFDRVAAGREAVWEPPDVAMLLATRRSRRPDRDLIVDDF